MQGREGGIIKAHMLTFLGDRYVHYIDCGNCFTDVHMLKIMFNCTLLHQFSSVKLFIYFFKDFVYLGNTAQVGGQAEEAGSLLSRKPDPGLDNRTMK